MRLGDSGELAVMLLHRVDVSELSNVEDDNGAVSICA